MNLFLLQFVVYIFYSLNLFPNSFSVDRDYIFMQRESERASSLTLIKRLGGGEREREITYDPTTPPLPQQFGSILRGII